MVILIMQRNHFSNVTSSLAKRLLAIITKGAATCDKVYFNVFNEMVHPITVCLVLEHLNQF